MGKRLYLAGAHSTGKSTLIGLITKENNDVAIAPRIKDLKKYENTNDEFLNAVKKLKRYQEEARNAESDNSKKAWLMNRGPWCNLAYMDALPKLGMMPNDTKEKHEKIYQEMFGQSSLKPKYIIYLAPPFEKVKEWLIQRNKGERNIWNDPNILKRVMQSYEELYWQTKHEYKILRLTSTHTNENLEQTIRWIKKQGII